MQNHFHLLTALPHIKYQYVLHTGLEKNNMNKKGECSTANVVSTSLISPADDYVTYLYELLTEDVYTTIIPSS